ncbi:MAG: hypothetical protein JWP57_1130 [Spirosoma sp.]|nr:hypothetical protein [Spirosoma sp.]
MKMHIFLIVSVLLVNAIPTLAQSRFSVGITAAPVVSYTRTRQHVLLPDYVNPGGPPIDNVFDFRSTIGGYTVGGTVLYDLTPRWSVTSGVWVSQTRTTGTFPFMPGNLPARIVTSALQIPLLVNYRPSTRRLSPYFSVGVVGSSRRPTVYKPVEGAAFSTTKVTFNNGAFSTQALVGAGVSYKITPNVSLTMQPLIVWHFKPSGNFEHYIVYQINGQSQLLYTF